MGPIAPGIGSDTLTRPSSNEPTTVAITITNVPPHTTTLVHGKMIELPGEVALDKGTERTSLVLRAPGYKPFTLFVIPDHDQSLTAEMRPEALTTKPPENEHDTIHLDHGAFGGHPKR